MDLKVCKCGSGLEVLEGTEGKVTDEQLDLWTKLCKDATPGPWQHVPGFPFKYSPDALFILFAREAMPRLIAEVRRLCAENVEFGQ